MIHMNPPINITNYDKRRANSERERNLGLADLSLEELKTIPLERQEAMGLCQHPGGLLKISSTLPSCNVVFTFLFHHTTFEVVIDNSVEVSV
jgi:hypothetical protein